MAEGAGSPQSPRTCTRYLQRQLRAEGRLDSGLGHRRPSSTVQCGCALIPPTSQAFSAVTPSCTSNIQLRVCFRIFGFNGLPEAPTSCAAAPQLRADVRNLLAVPRRFSDPECRHSRGNDISAVRVKATEHGAT